LRISIPPCHVKLLPDPLQHPAHSHSHLYNIPAVIQPISRSSSLPIHLAIMRYHRVHIDISSYASPASLLRYLHSTIIRTWIHPTAGPDQSTIRHAARKQPDTRDSSVGVQPHFGPATCLSSLQPPSRVGLALSWLAGVTSRPLDSLASYSFLHSQRPQSSSMYDQSTQSTK
jgi:hypothetical protein